MRIPRAAELNPAAVSFKLPDQIEWKAPPGEDRGARNAVLVGDPSKPGLYLVMTKWLAAIISATRISSPRSLHHCAQGTWWVGTGTKFDPSATVPMPAGTFVTHYGQQVHFDGAKDEDAVCSSSARAGNVNARRGIGTG